MTKAKRVIAITAAALLVLALLGICFVSDHESDEEVEVKSEPIDTVELVIVQQAVQLAEAAGADELQVEYEYIPSTEADEGYISELELIEITEEYGRQYNICPELLQAIAMRESTLYLEATNGDCKGLMQISERWHTQRMERLGVTDIYDARGNILLAADYIAELRDTTEYGYDLVYVLMRYNMRTDTANELYEAGTISNYAKEVVARANELERLHGK
jgi:soluble lytic murein transglycosylase-like protein